MAIMRSRRAISDWVRELGTSRTVNGPWGGSRFQAELPGGQDRGALPGNQPTSRGGCGGPALTGSSEKPAEMQGRTWGRQGGDTEAKVRLLKWGHPGSHKVTF